MSLLLRPGEQTFDYFWPECKRNVLLLANQICTARSRKNHNKDMLTNVIKLFFEVNQFCQVHIVHKIES